MAASYQSNFVASYGPLAARIATATGLDPSVVLGHMALETGWGRNTSGNNLFGINGPDGKKGSYPDIAAAADHYTDLMNGRYQAASAFSDPSFQAQTIAALGYNTNPKYGPMLSSVAGSVRDLMTRDAGQNSGNPLSPETPQQQPNALAAWNIASADRRD